MSTDGHVEDDEWTVEDDEEYVNKRKKERILALRQSIDEWKEELFTEMRLNQIDEETAMLIWGDRVRDYLLAIEPLFYHDGMPNAEKTFIHEELGYITVDPPDRLQHTAREAARATGGGSGYELLQDEPPQTKQVLVKGLKAVIENEIVAAEWTVQVRKREPERGESRREQIAVQNDAPLNRTVLQNAVRVADEFLQQAGVGLKLTLPDYNPDEPGL